MKIKKLLNVGPALLLSLSALLTVSIPMAHAATFTCTWTDASGTDNNFSTATNWSNCNSVAPGAGSDSYNLDFPSSALGFQPVDDIASLSVGTIAFDGTFSNPGNGGYDLTASSPSNVITVDGGITDTTDGPGNTFGTGNEIDVNLTTAGAQTFSAGVNSVLILGDGTLSLNTGASTLTLGNVQVINPITGSGSLIVDDANYPADVSGVDLLASSPSFTGSVAVNTGALFVDDTGSLSSASQVTVASGALLKGGDNATSGGVSSLTVQSGGTVAPGHSPGCITASNATINGTYLAQIGGTNACADYDQLQVSGSVNVTGGTLQTSVINSFAPTAGQTFEIIDNTGGSAVTGTFAGLPEGATFTSGGATFKISYVGGTGNDVTLTVVGASGSSGSGSSGTSGSSGSSAAAPKTPNTGLDAVLANPAAIFAASSVAALTLVLTARRLKPGVR